MIRSHTNQGGNNNSLTPYQLSLLLTLFVFGDTFIIFSAFHDPQHCWLSVLLAGLGGSILLLIYLWLFKMNRMQPFSRILQNCFGKYPGILVSLWYVFFFINNSSLVLFNYSNYLMLTNYYDTPRSFIILVLCAIVVYALLKGMKVIGRSAEFFFWIILASVIATTLFSLRIAKVENLFPIGYWNLNSIFKDSLLLFLNPFGLTVVFLAVFPPAKNIKDIGKPLFIGFGIILGVILLVYLRTLLVSGSGMISRYVYAFHSPPFSMLKTGIFISSTMALGVLARLMVLLYASVSILKEVFNTKNYRMFAVATVFVAAVWGTFKFQGIMQLVDYWRYRWPYYAAIFEIGIPLVLLIISLFKRIGGAQKV